MNPFPRTTPRMEAMVTRHLRKGETVRAAVPMWVAGTYRSFIGAIGVSAGFGAVVAALTGADFLIMAALSAGGGALIGRALAVRKMADHPIDAKALQVFVGVTAGRFLVYEPKSWGKPARLLAEHPLATVRVADFEKGNLLRLSKVTLGVSGVVHQYEVPGLWDIDELLEAIG